MKELNRTKTDKPVFRLEKVIQFGGGNFLRAFADWMIDVLNRETDFNGSVVIVKPTEKGDYEDLRKQDGLFHVVADGVRKGTLISQLTLVESVSRVIHPYNEWKEYLSTAEQPEIRFIISNTTEAGIKFSEKDRINDAPPMEFPAKLTKWLYHRFIHFEGLSDKGCILLPCELIENNGEVLKKAVLQYSVHWNLGQKFYEWLNESCIFCNTLVDRIVSGYPKEQINEIETSIGFTDALLVACEEYHSWLISAPRLNSDELPFNNTKLNVQFVEDLSIYRELKVRVLNGAHTSLVPVGYLSGYRTVGEAIKDATIKKFIFALLSKEVKSTLKNLSDDEINIFIDSVLDRFQNPKLIHLLSSISLNSIAKFRTRLLPAMEEFTAKKGTFPKHIAFSLACLIRFYKGEFNDEVIPLNDDIDVVRFFKNEWSQVSTEKQTLSQLVSNVLRNKKLFGKDLTNIPLEEYIVQCILNIENEGVMYGIENI